MTQFVYGKNVVKQILQDPSKVHEVFLQHPDASLQEKLKRAHVPVKVMDRQALTKLCGSDHHQGFVAKIDSYRLYQLEDILGGNGLIVLLDELEDPHNLGAILRTCDAVGVDGVIFKKNRSVGLNATVAKVSTGAIDTVKCVAVTNLVQTVQTLKDKGYWIVGTDMNGQDYRDLQYDFPTVLVIGNEGKGISRLLRENCDYMVSIPMVGSVESLNASVSAGILLYGIYDKRFPR